MSDTPQASGPSRELTPDEIVADIEAMKPRKRKVTIYQSWPRMILERERAAQARAASQERPQPDVTIGEMQQRLAVAMGCPLDEDYPDCSHGADAWEYARHLIRDGYAIVPLASQERPSIDVERIVRETLAIVDATTPLSVGEPLVQRILARLSGPVGEGGEA